LICPPVDAEEPILLVAAVLGAIFGGIASPTEAAAIGAAGAIVSAAVHRKLNWQLLKEAGYRTMAVNGMIMWILFGAFCFSSIFFQTGGPQLVRDLVIGLAVEPIHVFLVMLGILIILGCFVDGITQMMITLPIFLPTVLELGYDPVWFGVLFMVQAQISYLTPPFGFTLFYMKGVAPPEVTMGDIYRSILPFIGLQSIGLLAVLFFPQLALWLPDVVFGLR